MEKLAEEVHHIYCEQYEKDHGKPYWTNGDYSKLDERVKEYDRNIVRWAMKLLDEESGRIIKRAEESSEKRVDEHGYWISINELKNILEGVLP